MRVVAYRRVSSEEQGDSGAGLEAQAAVLEGWRAMKGDAVTSFTDVVEVGSAKDLGGRPELDRVLTDLDRGVHDTLVVSKLDRLSRSVVDFYGLLERAQRRRWSLVALDVNVDMTHPTGEMVVGIMVTVSQWERKMIGLRTREALAAVAARGVRLGGVPEISPDVEERIRLLHASGVSMNGIAQRLNSEGVPGARGGVWRHSTVARVLRRSAG